MMSSPRSSRRTIYPALMLFLIVYLATLAMIVAPDRFRALPPGQMTDAVIAGPFLAGGP